MLYLGGGAREVCLIPFLVRRIILCLRPPPKPSRYGTAIEESLKASSRGVLPAFQAGGRGSDSQEMVGAMDVETRGAIEVGERDGGSDASRSSRGSRRGREQGRGMGPCSFSQGEGGGRGGRPTLLSPAERVFAEVRRWVEGRRYECPEAKKAAGEGVLRGLEAEAKVSSLVGRPYIRQALNALPS